MTIKNKIQLLYPIGLLLFVFLLTYFLYQPASRIQLNNAIHNWTATDSSTVQEYIVFSSQYDDFGFIVLFYQVDQLYSKKHFAFNQKLISRFERVENVKEVIGLSNFEKNIDIDVISNIPRWNHLISSVAVNDSHAVINDLLFQNNLISKDLNYSLIKISVKKNNALMNYRTMNRVYEVLNEQDYKFMHFGISGTIPLYEQINRLSSKQSAIFVVLNLAIIFLLFIVYFSSIKYAIFVLLNILISIIWVLGLFSWFSFTATNITISLLVLIQLSAITNSSYILVKYTRIYRSGVTKFQSLIQTYRDLYRPSLFSNSIAVAIFGLYGFSSINSISSLGFFSIAAIIIPFFLSLTLLPALILVFDRVNSKFNSKLLFAKISLYLSHLIAINKSKRFQIVMYLLIVFSLLGLFQVKTNSNILSALSQSDNINQSYRTASEQFSGLFPIEVIIAVKPTDLIVSAEFQHKLTRFVTQLENKPAVKKLVRMSQSVNEYHSNRIRLTIYTAWLSSSELHGLIDSVKNTSFEYFDKNSINIVVTGAIPLRQFIVEQLFEFQALFVLACFALILLLSFVFFRKLNVALRITGYSGISLVLCLSLITWFTFKIDVALILFFSFALYVILNFIITMEYVTNLTENNDKINDIVSSNQLIFVIVILCCLLLLFSKYPLHYYLSLVFILSLSIFSALFYLRNQKN